LLHAIEQTANGYRVGFKSDAGRAPYLTFDFDYVEPTSWGILTTLTVRTTIDTITSLPDDVVLLTRMNLMKESELEQVAKRIGALILPQQSATPQDWRRHLEWATVILNSQLQKSVPTMDMSGEVMTERRKFLIDGLLAQGKANILYGPGGAGKSVLAVRIAAAVAHGGNLFGWAVRDEGTTLYLDWEDDATTMVERTHMVSKGMGRSDNVPVVYQSLHGKGPYERHHADVLFHVKQDPNIKLVIFDSTAMAMHGSSSGEGADGAIRFYSLVSQIPATVLLLDHLSSDDIKSGSAAKPYGSVFKVNSARNVWEHRPWNPQAGVTGFTLVHRKTNVGPRLQDRDVSVSWGADDVRFDDL